MKTEFRNFKSLYSEGHLFVAAIRILDNQKSKIPTINEICDILSFSPEKGNLIARKLLDLKIVKRVSGGRRTGFAIENHIKIEELPKNKKEDGINKEIEKFISSKKKYTQKIETIKAESKKKKKNLFAGIETQLKKNINKNSNGTE